MKRIIIFFLSFFLLASLMVAVALYVPTSLPAGSDFLAIYNADLALVNGVPIYDFPAVREIALKVSGIPDEHFFLVRCLYPPWYALSTFYLGLLPAKAAATLWFEINLLMLFFSIWFLTDGWEGRLRLVTFPIALLFLPVLGTLSVGEYDFPVLLGASMLVYSLRKENVALTVLGAVLLTFKPHVGALVLLSALIHLALNRSNFGRSAMRSILVAGGLLFVIGFIADPAWPVNYPKVLFSYQEEEHVSECSGCANLPIQLSRWFFDGSFERAVVIAVVLLVVLVVLFYWLRSSLFKSYALFSNAALLITLLVSPYLYNYDYILLLVPFAFLVEGKKSLVNRIMVVLCCFLPSIFIIGYGHKGDVSLIVATILAAILFYLRAKSPVDVPAFTPYNTPS